jgi:hypothetical protein
MRVEYDQGTAIIFGMIVFGGFDTSPARFNTHSAACWS